MRKQIHTLELAWYNLRGWELLSASELECWLFWLLQAHEYERAALLQLLPQPSIRQAEEGIATYGDFDLCPFTTGAAYRPEYSTLFTMNGLPISHGH